MASNQVTPGSTSGMNPMWKEACWRILAQERRPLHVYTLTWRCISGEAPIVHNTNRWPWNAVWACLKNSPTDFKSYGNQIFDIATASADPSKAVLEAAKKEGYDSEPQLKQLVQQQLQNANNASKPTGSTLTTPNASLQTQNRSMDTPTSVPYFPASTPTSASFSSSSPGHFAVPEPRHAPSLQQHASATSMGRHASPDLLSQPVPNTPQNYFPYCSIALVPSTHPLFLYL
ncbi:hypothetical protein CYMTET_29251 [Cymbomonas tetramitiformis]|uniref:Uncharacterized protein n=1 Tax=Cymbomonas tetramitiformis TaxID=36881 RepID=A0AAE0FLD9_9CHLO|nr:hypothetical protein CYMTET_29251 [Cymbomonas tetramitiformis]